MAQRVNESVYKAIQEPQAEEMRKKIEEEVTAKLTVEFSNEWVQKEAILKNELVVEKAALKQTRKKVQSKINTICNFLTSQAVGLSSKPPKLNPDEYVVDDDTEDDGADHYGIPHLGEGSEPWIFYFVIGIEQQCLCLVFRMSFCILFDANMYI